MSLGHIMDNQSMLDFNNFFRIRNNRLEVFVTGLSVNLPSYAQLQGENIPITTDYRITWISNKIKETLNNLSLDFVVLDCRMENYHKNQLIKGIINSLQLHPKQLRILISTYPACMLEGCECEIDLTGTMNYGYSFTDLLARQIDWENVGIDVPIISLAGRPTESRAKFIKDMVELYGDKARLSFGNIINFPISDEERNAYKEILYPYSFPFNQHCDNKILAYPNELLYFKTAFKNVGYNLFQSLINVVNETMEFDSDVIFVTEKTFKAFAWHQIPIFNAAKGHVEVVRSLGFDLFDDIINHSYDVAPNLYVQKLKILNIISKLLKENPTIHDINNLRKNIFHRLQANNELLYKLYKQRPYEPWPYYG